MNFYKLKNSEQNEKINLIGNNPNPFYGMSKKKNLYAIQPLPRKLMSQKLWSRITRMEIGKVG